MSSSGIKAGRAFVELTADDSKLQAGLRRAQAKMRRFASSVGAAGKLMAAAGGAIVAPATIAAKLYSSVGDELDKISERTGVSIEALSELGFAAEQSGGNMKSLEKALKKMQTSIVDANRGMASSVENFDELGLSVDDLIGKSPEQQFNLIADGIGSMDDAGRRTAIAIGLLGRAGHELLPMLKNGSKGMDELRGQARDLGIVISTDAAHSAAVFTDKMNILAKVLRINVFEIGASLAPTIISAAKTIREIATDTIGWIKENREAVVGIVTMAAKVALAGVALIAFSTVATATATTIGVLSSAVKGLNAAMVWMVANPAIIGIFALATAMTVLTVAMIDAMKPAESLSESMRKLTAEGDKQRAADLSKLERLKKLSNAGDLNARQMVEAKKLSKELTSRYGNLGIEIGKNTVKIKDQVAAFKKLNEQANKEKVSRLTDELKSLQRDLFAVEKKRENFKKSSANKRRRFDSSIKKNKGFDAESKIIIDKMNIKRAERSDILTGKIKPLAPLVKKPLKTGGETDRLKKLKAELAKLNEAEERKRRTSVQNEIADIKKAAEVKIKLIKQIAAEEKAAGRTTNEPTQIESVNANATKQIAAVKERESARLKSIDSEAKAAKNADQQTVIEENKRIAEQIARVRIEQTLKGAAKERALLKIERQKAIEDAKAIGADTGLVDRLFDLKNKAIQATIDVQSTIKQSVLGSFSTSGIAQGFSSGKTERLAEVTAKATQATASSTEKVARIIENMADNGLTFA